MKFHIIWNKCEFYAVCACTVKRYVSIEVLCNKYGRHLKTTKDQISIIKYLIYGNNCVNVEWNYTICMNNIVLILQTYAITGHLKYSMYVCMHNIYLYTVSTKNGPLSMFRNLQN